MIVRGRISAPGRLPQTTMRVGSPSSLRFFDGKVVDANGRTVRTEPWPSHHGHIMPDGKTTREAGDEMARALDERAERRARLPPPVKGWHRVPTPTETDVTRSFPTPEPARARFEVHPAVFIFAALVAGYCLGLLRATLFAAWRIG